MKLVILCDGRDQIAWQAKNELVKDIKDVETMVGLFKITCLFMGISTDGLRIRSAELLTDEGILVDKAVLSSGNERWHHISGKEASV